MSLLSLILPTIGQPDATEDVKLNNALTAIQTWANGNVDGTNLSATAAQSAAINQSGQVVKGSSIVATSQSTGSASFTTLATPDQVSNVVLATAGLIAVWYQATWQESVSGAAAAALFLGANQIKIAGQNGIAVQGASIGGTANEPVPLWTGWASSPGEGLVSIAGGTGYPGDVTTGQLIGTGNATGFPVYIFAAAGTYTVSVQFKTTSGTVTVASRRLYVQAISFT